MSVERTLADVPGIDALLPDSSAVLPTDSSIYEVNAFGDTTSDPLLGTLGATPYSSDPFSYNVGFMDDPNVNDPMRKHHLPSYGGGGRNDQYYNPDAGYTSTPTTNSGSPVTLNDGTEYTAEQTANVQAIVEAGKEVGATDRDIQVAVMAAMVESNLQNLDYGDRDSIGMFQQRDAWGSREKRLDPHESAKMFFLGGDGGQQGLLDIPNRDKRSMGDLAQDVQVSAFPDRYAEREASAASLLGSLNASVNTKNDSAYIGPYKPNDLLERANKLAAAGGKDPYFNSIQDGSWYNDCQHFVANLSGRSSSGYATASSAWSHFEGTGAAHAATAADGNEPPVGAWLYYSTSHAAGHVAVYLGGGKVASTDVFGKGTVGIGDMSELTDGAWHLNYLGWAAPWGEGKPKPLKAPADKTNASPPTWKRSASADRIVRQANSFLGTPFKWGGEDYSGVDSYGLIRSVYGSLGIDVPKSEFELTTLTDPVPVDEAKVGDVIVWNRHPETGQSHVGILMDGGVVASVLRPGSSVQLDYLGDVTHAWGLPIDPILERRRRPSPSAGGHESPYSPDAPPQHGTPEFPSTPSAPSGGTSGSGGSHHPHGGPPPPPTNHDIRTGPGGQGTGTYIP